MLGRSRRRDRACLISVNAPFASAEPRGKRNGTYHNPCKVQESTGPTVGFVSQNWVRRSCPPG